MTREDAIICLKWHKDDLSAFDDTVKEAIDMAIEALQREDRLLKSLETNEPIYDMVDVVRCGECKHLHPSGRCEEFADDGIRPSATDYCSYGERKGGDDE